jgi:hypothetical protein
MYARSSSLQTVGLICVAFEMGLHWKSDMGFE